MHRILSNLLCLMLILLGSSLTASAKDYVIVIDPGHGGRDAGALGQRTNEKSVNLQVGLRLRDLINASMPDAKVLMTRSNDSFVTLQKRADFANKHHADLFISIHANSVDAKSPMRTKVNGAAVYTLGLQRSSTNLEVAMRENEVMKLEPDYTTTYQGFDPSSSESYIAFEMMQHANLDQSIALAQAVQNQLVRTAGRKNNGVRQAPFWVLVRTSMPSILVELDFICNPAQEKYMASEAGQKALAQSIFNGISKYRGGTVTATTPTSAPATAPAPAPAKETAKEVAKEPRKESAKQNPATAPVPEGIPVYKIQFYMSSRLLKAGDSQLKGIAPVEHYKDGGMYKYTYGNFSSTGEANKSLPDIKRKFADAFVIKTIDGKRVK